MSGKKDIEKTTGIAPGKSDIHGIGVFATRVFKKGELIEHAPLVLLDNTEREQLQNTVLFDYYFLIGNRKTPVALGLGMASLYNHAMMPNADYTIDLRNEILIIRANQTISAGTEITINYHGKTGDDTPVFFNQNKNEQATIS